MLTGRRNFLKVTSAALAGLAIEPLQAVIANKDLYVNRALGLAFYKPKGWYFLNILDFGELTDKLSLAEEWRGNESLIWNNTGEPICLISKLDQNDLSNKGKYSPSIAVWAHPKSDYNEYDFKSLEQYSDTMIINRSEFVEDSNILDKQEPYELNGIPIMEYDWEYSMQHKELLHPLRLQVKMLYAEHDSFYYCFDFIDCKEEDKISEYVLRSFKKQMTLI